MDIVAADVERFLHERFHNLTLDEDVKDFSGAPELANHVENLRTVNIVGNESHAQIAALESTKVKVHVYRLCSEITPEGSQESDTETGLWDSLIYESDLRGDLLSYVLTTIYFAKKRVDPNIISCSRLILLYGAPGTGKTTLSKALAQKVSIRVSKQYSAKILVEINAQSIFSKYFSESGNRIFALFRSIADMAENPDTFVIVLIGAKAHKEVNQWRASGLSDNFIKHKLIQHKVVNVLLTQLDKLRHKPNILILTTSNLIDAIDPALLDRVDFRQKVDIPNDSSAYNILRTGLNELITKHIIFDA